jgi:chromosomal replication initiator protein
MLWTDMWMSEREQGVEPGAGAVGTNNEGNVKPQSSPSPWNEFIQILESRVTPNAFQTWLEPLDADLDDSVLALTAPTDFHRRWVRDRYLPAISEAAITAFGDEITVELAASPPAPAPPDASASPAADHDATPTREPIQGQFTAPMQDLESRLIAKYTFDNFVVGQSNKFANVAALAVAEAPGSHYNPLFIYGQAGLGKTHLLHAVGHHRREILPGSVVRYISSEQFFNEFINGIRRKRMDEFKARYRTIDVLLLDDVQFFDGKEQILEEFFHTFNSLYEAGKHMVISSDRHPKDLSTLEDRLRSRFEWGLLTDIQPPDVETRLAILRKNAEFAPTRVPTEVLEFIAIHVLDNIRELEGALTRVTAYASLTHEPVTLEMATEVLSDLAPSDANRPLTADDIIRRTSDHYGVTPTELTGPSRKQPLARTRQVAMYLCRENTDLSLPKIGRAFGGRDHTTVLHAVEKIKSLMRSDKQVFDEVNNLSQKLRRT